MPEPSSTATSLGCAGLQSKLGQLLESSSIVLGDGGQDLAVELDPRLLQAADELGVAGAVLAAGSVDARDPQAAEIALTQLAAHVGVDPALVEAVDGLAKARTTPADESLVCFDDPLVAATGIWTPLYT